MTKEKAKEPQIRFKGFTNAWEQRKVGDLFNERNEQYPMSEEYPLMAFIANIGVAPKGERYDRSALVNDEVGKKYKRTEKGDFIYSSNNLETGSIGLNNYGKACISPVYSIFKSKHNADSDFLGRMLLRKEFINDMVKFRQGVVYGQWKIHEKDFLNLDISVPLLPEQQQIGRCFRGLDHLITLHQRKCDLLCKAKKTLLQKMFPKNGETTPEIRFKGFTGAWEQRKLGELANIVRGASPRPIQDPKWFDDESDVGWLRIADVTEQDGRIHHLEQHISKLGQEKTRVLTEPHLLLSIAATVGKPVVNYVKTGVHDGFLIFLEPKFNRVFMFQWLEMFRPKWQKYGQPGSQVNLNSDLVKNQEIALPREEEQQKIGAYFAKLDHLITLHQHELEKLQNIKKSCLKMMFV